jgi:hypothetical protein
MRIGGNIFWATDFNETIVTERTRVGGKGGGGQRVTSTTYVRKVELTPGANSAL